MTHFKKLTKIFAIKFGKTCGHHPPTLAKHFTFTKKFRDFEKRILKSRDFRIIEYFASHVVSDGCHFILAHLGTMENHWQDQPGGECAVEIQSRLRWRRFLPVTRKRPIFNCELRRNYDLPPWRRGPQGCFQQSRQSKHEVKPCWIKDGWDLTGFSKKFQLFSVPSTMYEWGANANFHCSSTQL